MAPGDFSGSYFLGARAAPDKYDQWPHDSYMTRRAGVWEADDIVKFYIALLDFFPATL
jgi:hypothetical protein